MVQRVVETFFNTLYNPLYMRALEGPGGWSKGWSRKRRTNPPVEGTINNEQEDDNINGRLTKKRVYSIPQSALRGANESNQRSHGRL